MRPREPGHEHILFKLAIPESRETKGIYTY